MGMVFIRRAAMTLLAATLLASVVVMPGTSKAQTGVDAVIDAEQVSPVTANWVDVGGNMSNDR